MNKLQWSRIRKRDNGLLPNGRKYSYGEKGGG